VERTRLFVYVVDLAGEDPVNDLETVRAELAAYDPALAARAGVVAANKLDLAPARERLAEFQRRARAEGLEVAQVSALTGQGVDGLVARLSALLGRGPR
jgi:GTP-binding protein